MAHAPAIGSLSYGGFTNGKAVDSAVKIPEKLKRKKFKRNSEQRTRYAPVWRAGRVFPVPAKYLFRPYLRAHSSETVVSLLRIYLLLL